MYIQDMTKQLNLSKKAINLYEKKGLIKPSKDKLGYRIYTKQDVQTLLKIKQLRRMNFSIAEIKDILIHHQYDLFHQKKEDYLKAIYEMETSIQFIDSVKECIENQEDFTELANDLERIYALKEMTPTTHLTIDFDQVVFMLSIFAFFFALKDNGSSHIYEIIGAILMGIALAIYFSSKLRNVMFKVYKNIKKY